ncbi:MAG: PQQ-like beta-propeller repeat protein [Planctomycetia bacterium]|nr:PQQ-like beta-propeller repeat protein [Planctomycetia bacterium]
MLLLALLPGCNESKAPAAPVAPVVLTTDPITFGPNDWPWWRGPNRDGIAIGNQDPPLTWSETENVIWKTPIAGRSHGAATVVGERVFLAKADVENQSQAVLCFDRQTGKPLWETELHRGGFDKKGNQKSSHASVTPACDGTRVFVNFLHDGAVFASALSVTGEKLWETKITDFVNHQGFGSSPAIYQSLVIVTADNKGTGAIAALDRASGAVVWKQERPKVPNYTSPIILKVDGREQLFITGCDLVSSFDPATGKKIWEFPGATTECVISTVTDGKAIFTSGGYPKNHFAAVRADGSGTVLWENKSRVYVPSPLVRDGYLYAVMDAGVAMCWNSATGEEMWKGRLGSDFSASPVLVGDKLFAVSEKGKTSILRATPKEFELIGENTLGDETFATPTFCGNRIYMRAATTTDGKRQETLYCLGKPDAK